MVSRKHAATNVIKSHQEGAGMGQGKTERRTYRNRKVDGHVGPRRYRGRAMKIIAAKITDKNIVAISELAEWPIVGAQDTLIKKNGKIGDVNEATIGDYVTRDEDGGMQMIPRRVFEMVYKEMEE